MWVILQKERSEQIECNKLFHFVQIIELKSDFEIELKIKICNPHAVELLWNPISSVQIISSSGEYYANISFLSCKTSLEDYRRRAGGITRIITVYENIITSANQYMLQEIYRNEIWCYQLLNSCGIKHHPKFWKVMQ